MSGESGGNQAQRVGMVLGILAAFMVLRRLRKRRKEKKLLKARARAKAHVVEQRVKEEKALGKTAKKAGGREKKGKKEKKKERSMVEQLVRFTILALMKKIISQQIEKAGSELGSSKLGKRVVSAAES